MGSASASEVFSLEQLLSNCTTLVQERRFNICRYLCCVDVCGFEDQGVKGEWAKAPVTVDSGAGENVTKRGVFPQQIVQTKSTGLCYRSNR